MMRFGRLLVLASGLAACSAPAAREGVAQSAPVRETTRTAQPAPVVAPPSAAPVAVAALPVVKESRLKVKRLVITSGIADREPVAGEQILSSDGSAIYAFAELANPDGESENVRITFERKGGRERVGNVTLPVPGKVSRHRTWAFTRFIRAPGVWEAVLWNEAGRELSRQSFEVGDAAHSTSGQTAS